uniref:Secreted protein n=1 Tax=Panstrongylus lignarius TaxID=156445 RepID=A0A224XSR4_9HEMI
MELLLLFLAIPPLPPLVICLSDTRSQNCNKTVYCQRIEIHKNRMNSLLFPQMYIYFFNIFVYYFVSNIPYFCKYSICQTY